MSHFTVAIKLQDYDVTNTGDKSRFTATSVVNTEFQTVSQRIQSRGGLTAEETYVPIETTNPILKLREISKIPRVEQTNKNKDFMVIRSNEIQVA